MLAEAWFNIKDLLWKKKRVLHIYMFKVNSLNYKNSFSYSTSGAILWNSLPCDFREAESLRRFKRQLKRDV